jgi:inosose dehydratase
VDPPRVGRPRAGPARAARHARRTPALTAVRVANAPCSYGAFEITVGVLPDVPGPERVLTAISGAGYEGTELGPPGYLGERDNLRERLEQHGLALVGGYIPIRFSQPEHWAEDLGTMGATLDLFAAADGTEAKTVPADGGSYERARFPGRAASDPSIGLDDAGWRRLSEGIARAADLARTREFEPTFHHHTATFVEAPWEIERVLELTDVGLLLDTGHLVLGGGDPTAGLRDWGDRINHVHVKDVRGDVLAGVIADRADMPEAWRRGVFCELGTGDVDLEGFFTELGRSRYSGWLVVEQDMVPQSPQDAAEAETAQVRNRSWLREHANL